MVAKIIEKRNYIILFIIVLLFLFILYNFFNNEEARVKTFNYFDGDITIEVYTNKNVNKVFKKVDKILSDYDLVYKNPSKADDELIKYGKSVYEKTDGLIDITSGKLIKALEATGEYEFKTGINNIDEADLDFSMIIPYYAMSDVKKCLEDNGIFEYIINENGNIITRKHYDNGKYKVSIADKDNKLINIVKLENESLAIRGNVKTFEPYMVNPLTSQKADDGKLVVVVGKDIKVTNMVANALYLMDIPSGKEFIKDYDVSVMWYENGEILKENFDKYIL